MHSLRGHSLARAYDHNSLFASTFTAPLQVVFDPSWNPALDLQAQDRAYRMGQTRDVEVYRLVGTGEQYSLAIVLHTVAGGKLYCLMYCMGQTRDVEVYRLPGTVEQYNLGLIRIAWCPHARCTA
jgi:hypothetical protein